MKKYSLINYLLSFLVFLPLIFLSTTTNAQKDSLKKSPHYTAAGFFDIHVCNWPDRPPFFMSLFSTVRFTEIVRIEIFYPDKEKLTELDFDHYKLITRKGSPEKRVFMKQVPLPDKAPDGWYTTKVTLQDGGSIFSKDYVQITTLQRPTKLTPNNVNNPVPLPDSLQWKAVDGAKYYQVFLRDMWDEGKIIFQSKLINTNKVKIPKGILEPGGYYTWKVHARNVNGDARQGDFNHGSISKTVEFTLIE